jgi:hypothetical protein
MESEILELQIAQQGKFGYRGPIAMPFFEGRPQPMQGWDQATAEVSLRVGWPRGREVRSVPHEFVILDFSRRDRRCSGKPGRRDDEAYANEELRRGVF